MQIKVSHSDAGCASIQFVCERIEEIKIKRGGAYIIICYTVFFQKANCMVK